jgi:hypothetical protein
MKVVMVDTNKFLQGSSFGKPDNQDSSRFLDALYSFLVSQ